MAEYVVRVAGKEDIPRLKELFAKSLAMECRRDPFLVPLEGDWEPLLAQFIRAKEALLLVLEVEGKIEGYLLAFEQVVYGPAAKPHPLRKILGLPRPRPLLLPFRSIWVEDVYLTRTGRILDGGRALARAVRNWAPKIRARRIAGSVALGNRPAEAFALALGMRPLRRIFVADLEDPSKPPPVPERDRPPKGPKGRAGRPADPKRDRGS